MNEDCLEGSTERSDGNRVRSARKQLLIKFCLEGSTPVEMFNPVLWRSAFQAHRVSIFPPGTSYPVTVATLRSAFQARIAKQKTSAPFPNCKQTLSPFHVRKSGISAFSRISVAPNGVGAFSKRPPSTPNGFFNKANINRAFCKTPLLVRPYYLKNIQLQTNVIAFPRYAQSVIFPFAIFTLLLFRKF